MYRETGGFDPSEFNLIDEQGHKKEVENLPYARKEAVEDKENADKKARLLRLTGNTGVKGVDLLHGEAWDYSKQRAEILEKLSNEQEAWRTHLSNIPEEFKYDKGVVLAVMEHHGGDLAEVSDQLKGDKDVVLAAIKSNPRAYSSASEQLRNDREVALAAFEKDGSLLEFAPENIQDDKELVLVAIKNHKDGFKSSNNGSALQFASDRLRQDLDVVLAAVEINPDNYQYADIRFRTSIGILGDKNKTKR